MVYPQGNHGAPTGDPQGNHGAPTGEPWYTHRGTMVYPQRNHGVPAGDTSWDDDPLLGLDLVAEGWGRGHCTHS